MKRNALILLGLMMFQFAFNGGCSGGGGNTQPLSPSPVPTPTPVISPTPSPTPTPTPTPASMVLNLVSPNSASAGGFSMITLTGTGFSSNAVAELIGTGDLLTEVDSSSQARAQLNPTLASSVYSLALHNGSVASNSLPLTISPTMALVPDTAIWGPNSAHTLRAKIFGATAGAAITWTSTGGTVDPTGIVDGLSGYSFTTFTAPSSLGSVQISATSGAFHATTMVLVSAAAGEFSSTSVCNAHGQDFTVTELPNGDIAVLGGDNGNGINEIYHSSSNTCSGVAPFIEPRYQHSAAFITSGVHAGNLIACGGFLKNTSSELSDCELYDPATDTWSHGPTMNLARHNFGIAELINGDFLFVGGRIDAKTEIYVAATGAFKAGCTTAAPRFLPGVATLPSGNVLIAGGATSDGINAVQAVASAELYKAATNSCVSVGSMLVARQAPNVSVLPDGRAVVSGTAVQGAENPAIEAFSESTLRFSVIGNKQLNTCCFSQTLIPGTSKLLLSGGIWEGEVTSQSEVFDPATGISTGTDNQKTTRFLQKALAIEPGIIVEIGGHGVAADPTAGEVYHP